MSQVNSPEAYEYYPQYWTEIECPHCHGKADFISDGPHRMGVYWCRRCEEEADQ